MADMLLLQLRDLVPPQPLNSQQEGLDNKRPKHVVLSDTIALVKELQDKVGSCGALSDLLHWTSKAMLALLIFACP